MKTSPKQQILDYLINLGYRHDSAYRGQKYQKLVHDRFVPIYMGKAGGFRRGHTIAESVSITDQLRAQRKLPAYGDGGPCETCRHYSIHDHRLNNGCSRCACRRYTTTPGWNTLAA